MPEIQSLSWLFSIGAFLLDMDGTTVLGDRLLPGVRTLIDLFRKRGTRFLFVTNNSSKDRSSYCARFRDLGLEISEEHVLTSGNATAAFLNKNMSGMAVYLVGTPLLKGEFERDGIELVPAQDAEVMVVGFDTAITYEELKNACDLARNGIPYLATHPDLNCPTENGFIPDVGAVLAFVEAATDRKPDVVVGKPHRPMIDAALQNVALPADRVCMVGDRLYTDIALGKHGLRTILVLSGEAELEDLEHSPFTPDLIVEDVQALLSLLQTKEDRRE